MTQVHVIASQKGGVGKTTTTVNLAAVVNDVLAGPIGESPVLVISTDPQASSVWWAKRVDGLPFDYAQAHEDTKQLGRVKKSGQYAHIFIDTPGSIQDERLLLDSLEIADDVLVPLPTEALAFDPTARTIDGIIRRLNLPYHVVINNWDPRDGDVDLKQTREFVDAKKWNCLNTVIRRYKVHTRAAAAGKVVTQYEPNRAAFQAREDFFKLALELGYGGRGNGAVPQQGLQTPVTSAV